MDGRKQSADRNETTPTLRVNPDDVCQLIQLARDFHAQDSVVVEDEPDSLTDDLVFNALEQHGEDPIVGEFRNIIADLDRGQQVQLVTLLWVGRGDYDLVEWSDAAAEADAQWTEYTADYLLAHPLLADHLNEGLEMLGHHCE
ncbi:MULTISPECIES: DUF3775 domain-containing protein [unclassified Wenzhouxiangella]|uniref:DUF3775 domain-containing protein n=1 Tax=unclassified Wenzhouxiangella TaxID=2613841 RepID=UPI000E327B47|nr:MULTISPECIES: DUF3775 domain-containing protein [unclassified Wenzhouxiangella]RFF26853.1 DUF3775 domain-containing protein [Wenzhouxiangella sp. 15181]RFP68493.1 DUF3775 domain-containing protein [Wenzhouxiangella sp. 15190]